MSKPNSPIRPLAERAATAFTYLPLAAIRHPARTLFLTLLVTAAMVPGLTRLKLRTDAQALVPADAPEVAFDHTIRQKFGIQDQMVVVIRSPRPEGIFNSPTLQQVRNLTDALDKLPGLTPGNILSLATEPSFRLRPGTLINQKLLDPPLTTAKQLEQLRDDLRRIELYTGTLVSFDGHATAIIIGVPDPADRPALRDQIRRVIAAEPANGNEIFVTGAPVAEALLGAHILQDLGVPSAWLGTNDTDDDARSQDARPHGFAAFGHGLVSRIGLVPLAVLVMLLVLWVAFRSLPAALAPLPGVAASLVFVLGGMGWTGTPVYLTTAVMPVLLAAIGVANDIYLFNRYFSLLRLRPEADHLSLVVETFEKLARPVGLTSLTGAVGFLSLGLSSLTPVRSFGLVTGIGVLAGLFYSLATIPALLVWSDRGWFVPARQTRPQKKWTLNLPLFDLPWLHSALSRRLLVLSLLLLTALLPLGLRRLTVRDGWLDSFNPKGEFRRQARFVNENFHGMHLLYISFSSPRVLSGELDPSAVRANTLLLPPDPDSSPTGLEGGTALLTLVLTNASGSPLLEWRTHVEMAARQGARVAATLATKDKPSDFADALTHARSVRYEIDVRTHYSPQTLQQLRDLEHFIRARGDPAVGAVLGPPDYLLTTRFMVRPNDPKEPLKNNVSDRTQEFWGLARRGQGAYPHGSVRSEQQSLRPKGLPPIGLRHIWPVAALHPQSQPSAGMLLRRALPQAKFDATNANVFKGHQTRQWVDDPAQIKLLWDYYGLALSPRRVRQLIDSNYWESLTTVFLKDANFTDTARLMGDLRDYERDHLAPHGIKIGFAGDVAVSQTLIQGIVRTQLASLALTLAIIFALTAFFGGSIRWGLYCLFPCVVALAAKFAVMGWMGIPLGVATSMFAAMTLGLGVNCAIHLLEGFQRASLPGVSTDEALARALSLTGPPALLNTLSVCLGFGVLMFSPVPANARLGALLVLGLAGCFVASIFLLPLLLRWWPLSATPQAQITAEHRSPI